MASQVKPGCQDKCGDICIPYPFGIGENCSREGFGIDCKTTDHGRYVPYISGGNIEIRNISLINKLSTFKLRTDGPYTLSNTQNKFTMLGCDTHASIQRTHCNGFGCCQTSIPKGIKKIEIEIDSYNNHSTVYDFNPCRYAFLTFHTDWKWFSFNGLPDLSREFYEKHKGRANLVLDWAIGNRTCEEAKRAVPDSDYACVSEKSDRYDSTNGPSYRCNCNSGYQGNPYLKGGCKGIIHSLNFMKSVIFKIIGYCD
ncbi:Wall-associated receptor kinase 5 [Acorus gramineus]|uniref:Wall-associated receptor kinase 5 n=1 Tax=Acorus gramineus TaxID=55184 RepID=A0AAV9ATX9_ACOGR|nr:Wall-associated receptor kinase 5 [Acorus gramineus]